MSKQAAFLFNYLMFYTFLCKEKCFFANIIRYNRFFYVILPVNKLNGSGSNISQR